MIKTEQQQIGRAIQLYEGDIFRAANALGITARRMMRKIRNYNEQISLQQGK